MRQVRASFAAVAVAAVAALAIGGCGDDEEEATAPEGPPDQTVRVGETEFEENLAPGESATPTVDLSEPGTYTWYCPVDDHKERGMVGEITVGGGGSAQDGEPSDQGGGSGGPTGGSRY